MYISNFSILKLNRTQFCNLFMEQPSYIGIILLPNCACTPSFNYRHFWDYE